MSSGEVPTRSRLLWAGLELVAEHGYEGTSVGDIEERAGLAPRSGALYQYFDSKLALVRAGLEEHLQSVEAMAVQLEGAELDELENSIALIGVWLLHELDRERVITHVIEREGQRLPDLRDRMRVGVSDRGYGTVASLLERWAARLDLPTDDHEALAVLLVGGLINQRRSTWTFAAAPLGVPDERILAAFESLVRDMLASPDSPGEHLT